MSETTFVIDEEVIERGLDAGIIELQEWWDDSKEPEIKTVCKIGKVSIPLSELEITECEKWDRAKLIKEIIDRIGMTGEDMRFWDDSIRHTSEGPHYEEEYWSDLEQALEPVRDKGREL